LQTAAAETIRRGYDKFIIVGAESQNNVRVVGTTPIYADTDVSGTVMGPTFSANAKTRVHGGQPIVGGRHDQDFAIKMFRSSDPGSENALDARTELGPDWEKKVKDDKNTCF